MKEGQESRIRRRERKDYRTTANVPGRRKCLEALLPNLENKGVDKLVMESHNPVQDARDVQLADIMKSVGYVRSIKVSHARGELEPRLWFPDLVLGAYGDAICEDRLPTAWKKAWEDSV